jgi:hypothetical protein
VPGVSHRPGMVIISHRKFDSFVGWEAIYELEDLLVHYCASSVADVEVIGSRNHLFDRVRSRLGVKSRVHNLPPQASALFVIARNPADLNVIREIRSARMRFPKIYGYVLDSYFWDGFSSATTDYDHLFVTGAEDAAFLRDRFKVKASILRQGIDTVRWYSNRKDRCIDVIGFGRTPSTYHRALQARFHRPESPFFYLHSPLGSTSGPDVVSERPMLFHALHRSKLCLAFHMFVEPVGDRPRSMMVTSRWLEGLASGCLVVGRRPVGEMAEDMLSWPEATFELSENASEAVNQIEDLVSDATLLDQRRHVNLAEVRKRHDLRWRLKEIMETLGLELPNELRRDLDAL